MSKKYVNIILDDQPVLRQKAVEVTLPLSEEDKDILLRMLEYIKDSKVDELQTQYNLKPGIGLAAPQLGISKRLIAIDLSEEKNNKEVLYRYALANPKIISHSEQQSYLTTGEGCLSVEQPHPGYVYRYARVTVKAYDLLQDKEIKIRATGYLAICLQHEIDHLNGVLFYDRINKHQPFIELPNAIKI